MIKEISKDGKNTINIQNVKRLLLLTIFKYLKTPYIF